jgi:hypothetical protein
MLENITRENASLLRTLRIVILTIVVSVAITVLVVYLIKTNVEVASDTSQIIYVQDPNVSRAMAEAVEAIKVEAMRLEALKAEAMRLEALKAKTNSWSEFMDSRNFVKGLICIFVIAHLARIIAPAFAPGVSVSIPTETSLTLASNLATNSLATNTLAINLVNSGVKGDKLAANLVANALETNAIALHAANAMNLNHVNEAVKAGVEFATIAASNAASNAAAGSK